MLPCPLRDDAELTLLEVADAKELFTLCDRNRGRLGEFLPWIESTHSPGDVTAFLTSAAEQHRDGLGFHAGIRVGGRLAGCAGMHPIDVPNRSVAIGYWIDRKAEGQGLITLAAGALVRLCFAEYGLHRVEIRCATHNHRSRAVPLRLGFREEGILRGSQQVGGRFFDQYVFGRLATDAGPLG